MDGRGRGQGRGQRASAVTELALWRCAAGPGGKHSRHHGPLQVRSLAGECPFHHDPGGLPPGHPTLRESGPQFAEGTLAGWRWGSRRGRAVGRCANKLCRGWNVIMSQQVLEWMAEGEARGEAKGTGRALLRLLELRFQTVPVEVVTAVRNTTDLAQLGRWLD